MHGFSDRVGNYEGHCGVFYVGLDVCWSNLISVQIRYLLTFIVDKYPIPNFLWEFTKTHFDTEITEIAIDLWLKARSLLAQSSLFAAPIQKPLDAKELFGPPWTACPPRCFGCVPP